MTDSLWENLIFQNFRIYLANKLLGQICRHFSIANVVSLEDKDCEDVVFLLSPPLPFPPASNSSAIPTPSCLFLTSISGRHPFSTIKGNFIVYVLPPKHSTFVDDVLALKPFFLQIKFNWTSQIWMYENQSRGSGISLLSPFPTTSLQSVWEPGQILSHCLDPNKYLICGRGLTEAPARVFEACLREEPIHGCSPPRKFSPPLSLFWPFSWAFCIDH